MHVSREHQAVYEEIGSCNDHSHGQPSNAPITERDGDDNMESSLINFWWTGTKSVVH